MEKLGIAIIDGFMELWETLPQLPFNPEWNNGTGYFDSLVDDKSVVGDFAFTDDKGRKGLVTTLKNGSNLVIFRRYKDSEGILVTNSNFKGYIFGSEIKDTEWEIVELLFKKESIPMKKLYQYVTRDYSPFDMQAQNSVLGALRKEFDKLAYGVTL